MELWLTYLGTPYLAEDLCGVGKALEKISQKQGPRDLVETTPVATTASSVVHLGNVPPPSSSSSNTACSPAARSLTRGCHCAIRDQLQPDRSCSKADVGPLAMDFSLLFLVISTSLLRPVGCWLPGTSSLQLCELSVAPLGKPIYHL